MRAARPSALSARQVEIKLPCRRDTLDFEAHYLALLAPLDSGHVRAQPLLRAVDGEVRDYLLAVFGTVCFYGNDRCEGGCAEQAACLKRRHALRGEGSTRSR